jgi:hypothetical protein
MRRTLPHPTSCVLIVRTLRPGLHIAVFAGVCTICGVLLLQGSHAGMIDIVPIHFLELVVSTLPFWDAEAASLVCKAMRGAVINASVMFDTVEYWDGRGEPAWRTHHFYRLLSSICQLRTSKRPVLVRVHTESVECRAVLDALKAVPIFNVSLIHTGVAVCLSNAFLTRMSHLVHLEVSLAGGVAGPIQLPPTCISVKTTSWWPCTPQPRVLRVDVSGRRYGEQHISAMQGTMGRRIIDLFPHLAVLNIGENPAYLENGEYPHSLRVLVLDALRDSHSLHTRMPHLHTIVCNQFCSKPHCIHPNVRTLCCVHECTDVASCCPPRSRHTPRPFHAFRICGVVLICLLFALTG